MEDVIVALAAMTDREVLEIVAGRRGTRLGALCDLAEAAPEELERRGLAPHRALILAAAFELGRRARALPRIRGDPILTPHDVLARYGPLLEGETRERVVALLLDSAKGLRREVTVSIGTVDSSLVIPRDALTEAVRSGAAGVLFLHNHPSGNPRPSPEDVHVTRRLREACRILGIEFVDHVILGGHHYFSFVEEGMT